MEHPDEGTIHTWLDNQLSDAEATALESHIASCEQCRATVAEARGFMASASRILGALDNVPGGVVPVQAEVGVRDIRVAHKRRRRWQLLSAAAGIALMVTGGMYVLDQTGANINVPAAGSSQLAQEIAVTAAQERSAATAGDSAHVSSVSGSPMETHSGATSARTDSLGAPPARSQSVQADVAATPPLPAPPAAVTTTASATDARTSTAAKTRGVGVVESNTVASVTELRERQGVAEQRAARFLAPRQEASVPNTSASALTGCYRITPLSPATADLSSHATLLGGRLRLTDSMVPGTVESRRFIARSLEAEAGEASSRVLLWAPALLRGVRVFIGDSTTSPVLSLSTDSAEAVRTGTTQWLARISCP